MAFTFTHYPADHAKKVRPRDKVYYVVYCDSAITDMTIKVNGVYIYKKLELILIPSYDGTYVPEDANKKATVRFWPIVYWQSNTKYEIEIWVKETAGATEHTETWDFTTGVYCLEDDYPTVSTMDQAIMTGFADSQCERLRRALMLICTDSTAQFPQARTIIWLSCMTELKTILAGVLDFDLVKNIHLCDRKSVVAVQTGLRRYMSMAKNAVNELKLKEEAKQLLRDYLESKSPIYAVNAVAAIIVLATRGLNL